MGQPGGTFYVFPNIEKTGLSSKEFCGVLFEKCHILASREAADYLLDTAHVATVPGSAFGASGEGYIRLVCACSLDTIKEVFDRMEKLKF